MIFTSFIYVYFIAIVLALYWTLQNKTMQNVMLLIASYVFYGYVHPWFCYLIVFSTILDYWCGLGMRWRPSKKKLYLILSLVGNLGMLGVFKYFNFFVENIYALLTEMGLRADPITLRIFLPVGISFYTFQTLSYTIDIYRDKMEPRKNFIDFALFVAFFPQLVAGPIERAVRLLPQIESPRKWQWNYLSAALPLILRGYLKKLVVADNVAIYVDKIFMLESPSLLLLFTGSLVFAVQIYADFSAYTDIARGSARLLGIELMENFKSPYVAISPSDFWRRWHISFSSWIRDYLYISLGGSRVSNQFKFLCVLVVSMGLSGLWHGAAWNFVAWGVFHGIILFVYHNLKLGGKWYPQGKLRIFIAWAVMFSLTLIGWLLFRTTSLAWLFNAIAQCNLGLCGEPLLAACTILAFTAVYSSPFLLIIIEDRFGRYSEWIRALVYAAGLLLLLILPRSGGRDFIYFRF